MSAESQTASTTTGPGPGPLNVGLKPPRSLLSHVKLEHLVAGVSGGVLSTIILHPLDLVKVRFQVNEGVKAAVDRPQYTGIMDAFKKIYKAEGLRGLYQGVTPNVWGAGASWGLYFLFYNSAKAYMQDGDDTISLSPVKHMTAAAEAGVLTLALTNPIWVAKTRMCLQYDSAGGSKSGAQVHYKGMADCLIKIYRGEGLHGLYKGFVPGLFGVSHGAIQFMAYEELKKQYNGYKGRPLSSKFGSFEYLIFAAMSKCLAVVATYPYQVVRARLQDQHRQFGGVIDVVRHTYKGEGVEGFYKGLVPNLLRVVPACCITFVVYEKVVLLLNPGR